MSSTPRSTGAAANAKAHIPASRRRDKPQLSCNLCRRRKLRCDRGHPCSTCAHRGLSHSCAYAANDAPPTQDHNTQPRGTLHDRIAELEKLARSLASSRDVVPQPDQPPDVGERSIDDSYIPEAERLHENLGRISMNDREANYVEGTHWLAILDGISELKDFLDAGVQLGSTPMLKEDLFSPSRPTLLCHLDLPPMSHQDMIANLPPKNTVDRLVVRCFSQADVLHFLFHAPTFQKSYATFWRQPQSMSLMWLASLYGMMGIGTYYEHFTSVSVEPSASPITLSPEAANRMEFYRRRMVHCMILGGYTKGVPHTIETILLYLQIEFLSKPESLTEFWLLLGVLINLANRLGFHRDGSQFSNITPFEAEMRRRHWCVISHMDVMGSTQFGLARLIDPSKTDVAPPRNLFDEDFDETTTTLPDSRPVTTVTPSLYLITKTQLFLLFGKITELSISVAEPAYTEIMAMDKVLDDAYSNLPPSLRMRQMTLSIIDKPELIIQRIWLQLLIHKSRCVLHRRFIKAGRSNKRWVYSRNSCIESALQMLKLQILTHEEVQPNGRLFNDRWRLSSLIMQEYLFATAILCVDAYADLELEASLTPSFPVDRQSRDQVLSTIRVTVPIWEQVTAVSAEARKAVKAIQVVLDKAAQVLKANNQSPEDTIEHMPTDFQGSDSSDIDSFPQSSLDSLHAAAYVEWQPLEPSSILPTYKFDTFDVMTPSTSTGASLPDPQSSNFQAQDLMDILQEDYPSMIL